jgi:SAM-dependent methyltransferase
LCQAAPPSAAGTVRVVDTFATRLRQRAKYAIPATVRRHIRQWRHRGTAVECPFCGFQARDLRPNGHDFPVLRERHVIGAGLRPVNCYKCGSGDRARLVYLYLRDHVGLDRAASMRVLHFAPEPGLREKLAAAGLLEYTCGDLFMEGYSYPDWVQNIDATDTKFEDDRFDVIICNHVLEHIPDDRKAMGELRRVLKPGGVAILQVPISANTATTLEDPAAVTADDRVKVYGQFDHVRLYGQDYVDRLSESGFDVRRVDVTAEYARNGVNPEEALFVCTK